MEGDPKVARSIEVAPLRLSLYICFVESVPTILTLIIIL